MSDPLQDRLDTVEGNSPPKRYVARDVGGGYWVAYDRILQRPLSNAELLAIPLDDLKIDAA